MRAWGGLERDAAAAATAGVFALRIPKRGVIRKYTRVVFEKYRITINSSDPVQKVMRK